MNINPKDIVEVDYSKYDIAAQTLKPLVFKDGGSFCCLYGDDPIEGVFGCGSTPEDAIEDWKDSLHIKLDESPRNDTVANFVRQKLGLPEKQMDSDVQAFYDQFKPRKK